MLPHHVLLARTNGPRSFEPYSAAHGLTVAAFLALTLLAITVRRRLRDAPAARRLDVALGIGGLIVWVCYKVWSYLPANFSWEFSLPLQMCDFTSLVAPLALLTNSRPLRAILYFCGIGLSSMGFFTPDLHQGPAHAKFWLFWLSHASIVGTALYDLAARGFRPTWRDYVTAAASAATYVVLALSVDLATGYNYGYVGPTRAHQPPILEALGPWPARIPVICALAAVVMALLQLPWEVVRRVGNGRARRITAVPDAPV